MKKNDIQINETSGIFQGTNVPQDNSMFLQKKVTDDSVVCYAPEMIGIQQLCNAWVIQQGYKRDNAIQSNQRKPQRKHGSGSLTPILVLVFAH